jgi:hypothetical protein
MKGQFTQAQIGEQFNKTLNSHLNRALGGLLPTGELNLDMVFVASVVLLAERETEIQSQTVDRRFTYGSLLRELSEMGFEIIGDGQGVFRQMEGAGYIRVLEDDTLLSAQPLLNMSLLLDRVFPKMPGINLVAYLVQTVEEVVSGRKDLQSADRQLDQVLGMQAEAFSRGRDKLAKKTHSAPRSSPSAVSSKTPEAGEKKGFGEDEKRAILQRLQAASRSDNRPSLPSAPGIIPAGKDPARGADDREEVKTEALELPDEGPVEKETTPGDQGVSDQVAITPGPEEAAKAEEYQATKATEPQPGQVDHEKHLPSPLEGEEKTVKTSAQVENDAPFAEEVIASRIAAFGETLAMTCPLCGKGKVEVHETSKGKSFYECSREGCYFISWGKPYHLVCPQCRNPFLIESLAGSDSPFLKCPRATCNYRQNLPGEEGPLKIELRPNENPMGHGDSKPVGKPRKRVVRRRVVRRKK